MSTRQITARTPLFVFRVDEQDRVTVLASHGGVLPEPVTIGWLTQAISMHGTQSWSPGQWPRPLYESSHLTRLALTLPGGTVLPIELWTLAHGNDRFIFLGHDQAVSSSTDLDQFQGMIDQLPFTVFIMDSALNIVQCNQYAHAIMGQPTLEQVNQNFTAFENGTDREVELTPLMQEVFENRRANIFYDLYKISELDGSKNNIFIWAKPLSFGVDGSVEQVVILVLGGLYQGLMEEVRLARIEAETADRTRARFISNVSHELRTPLTAVTGFMQLARQIEDTPPAALALIDKAMASTRQLEQRIHHLLEITKIDNRRLVTERYTFDMDALVADRQQVFADAAARGGLSFRTEITADLGEVETDKCKLQFILDALLENAVKFTDGGFVQLRVERETGALVIEVEDSGPGISLEAQSKLFNPLQHDLDYLSIEGKGAGLGLAIVGGYVDHLNGTVLVKSNPGMGTIFEVRLPLAPRANPETLVVCRTAINDMNAVTRTRLLDALNRADSAGFGEILLHSDEGIVGEQLKAMLDGYQFDALYDLLAEFPGS